MVNGGVFLAGLLAIVFGGGMKGKGGLNVDIAGHHFGASGGAEFVLVAFGVFLVAISFLLPG
jgi:hypothetical protein